MTADGRPRFVRVSLAATRPLTNAVRRNLERERPNDIHVASHLAGLAVAGLVPAGATALALLPLLFIDTNERPPMALISLLFLLAPLVALLVNLRWPFAATDSTALLAALPQMAIVFLIIRLAVWREYHGTSLEGSGEEAMAYGLSFFVSFFVGLIMVVLVSIAGHMGWRLARRHHGADA